jgi:hypothetical protein
MDRSVKIAGAGLLAAASAAVLLSTGVASIAGTKSAEECLAPAIVKVSDSTLALGHLACSQGASN